MKVKGEVEQGSITETLSRKAWRSTDARQDVKAGEEGEQQEASSCRVMRCGGSARAPGDQDIRRRSMVGHIITKMLFVQFVQSSLCHN